MIVCRVGRKTQSSADALPNIKTDDARLLVSAVVILSGREIRVAM